MKMIVVPFALLRREAITKLGKVTICFFQHCTFLEHLRKTDSAH